jgi:Uma2 family endonuclease
MAVGQRTTGVRRYRWTAKQFYRLLDKGFFRGKRVELIDGVIVQMAAQTNLHLASIDLTRMALQAAFGAGFWVRTQGSLDLSPYSVPDPDIAVVPGSPQGCSLQNPTTALLIGEVSLTTLAYDRNWKGGLYARAGLPDYWIVNLVHRQLEMYRNPIADSRRRFGYRYDSKTILQPGAVASPLAAPHAQVKVSDLLP